MLQKEVIEKTTFELLETLMNDKAFNDFFLVGGTSIALQLGHRKSIDLDLFTRNNINVFELNEYLKERYNFKERFRAKNTLKGEINGVFIDCIKYDYPFLKDLVKIGNIRIASLEDVIGMKLVSITDNGTRLKDFVDIAYLSTRYSLEQMLGFYKEKYQEDNIISPVKAITYFDEIDFEGEPVELLAGKFSWQLIRERLQKMVSEPKIRFNSFPCQQDKITQERLNKIDAILKDMGFNDTSSKVNKCKRDDEIKK